MGIEGLPQSGTGQTALFTGENAAALFGRHFGPWVPVPLRPLLMRENILCRAQAEGVRCAFANAYPSQFIRLASTKRPAGPPLAAHGAGLLTRTEVELARREAISSEILNTAWRTRLGLADLPEITPDEAGRTLARIATEAELTLFAHYSTDSAGHTRSMEAAVHSLERVDAFLAGLIPALPPETLLVLASDHGNIEDISQGHTRNPTFGLLWGPGAKKLGAGLSSITEIPRLILGHLIPGR
jgi:2,3-bisphosphoglycerate-independent phosphoglycerate mutase